MLLKRSVDSSCLSVRQLASHWADFHKTLNEYFLEIFPENAVSLNPTIITGTLHEDQYTFIIIITYFSGSEAHRGI
jgi:hypothetical protein